jgi:putative membrane protein
MGWGGGFMMIFWVLLIGLIIWGVVRLSSRGGYVSGQNHASNALNIAKERYARGEITKEEFEQLKRTLS